MIIYCPACGEYGESIEIDNISPGAEIEYRCLHCGTEYKIVMEYSILESEEEESERA